MNYHQTNERYCKECPNEIPWWKSLFRKYSIEYYEGNEINKNVCDGCWRDPKFKGGWFIDDGRNGI